MVQSEKIKIGVIGAGSIAKSAHLPALKLISAAEVAAIADVDVAAAKKTARTFNIPKFYINSFDLINDESIDLIDICTPPQVRLDLIKAAAEKGKHVLVEKPLALSLQEALEIYDAVKRHDIKLNIIQNFRYFPCVSKVKERISRGYLGDIISVQCSGLTPHPADSTKATWLYHYGGALFDFAPHVIDMLLWTNRSPVEKVTAFGGDFTGGNMGCINYAQILIAFQNRSVAVVDISWLTCILGMKFTMNIHGSGGHILMDIRNNNYLEFHGMLTPLDEFTNAAKKLMGFAKVVVNGSYFRASVNLHRALMVDFIESIKKGADPPVTIEQGLMVTAVLDAAKQSILQNKPVYIKDLFNSATYQDIIETLYKKTDFSSIELEVLR
jgi:predicted dehydrogenase